MAKTKVPASKPEWTMPAVLVKATTTPSIVTAPARVALAIDGRGDPDGADFEQAVVAIYGLVYGLRFTRKKAGPQSAKVPFKVGALEGVWSADNWSDPSTMPPRDRWTWRLRMAVPDDVSETELADIVQAATTKKGGKLEGSAVAGRVFLERIPEARLGRILHIGPYADEPRSFAALAAAVAAQGLQPSPWHIEIYLGDPRRTAPAKLKTVLLKELS